MLPMTGPARSWTCTAVALALAAGVLAAAHRPTSPRFLLGGIQVNEPDHEAWFRALVAQGLDTVSATVYAKQGDWDSDHLWWEDEEPHVVAEIRGAKRAGLRVVLIPRLALDHAFPRNVFLWHGMIQPRDDATLRAWFARYRTFVLRWAEVAAREGVDLFAVGSELSALTSTRPVEAIPPLEAWYLDGRAQDERRDALLALASEIDARDLATRGRDDFPSLDERVRAEIAADRAWAEQVAFAGADDAVERINARSAALDRLWRDLIADVRRVYAGPLTLAANFDRYDRVGFWDALDRIGINAYWSLRPGGRDLPPSELPAALDRAWEAILDGIDRVRRDVGRPDMPVVFTEIGYTSRRSATVQPWAGDGFWVRLESGAPELFVWRDEPVAPDERVEAVRSLARTLAARPNPPLGGLLWWKLSTVPGHRDIEPFVAILGDGRDDALFEALREVARAARGAAAGPELAPAAPRVY